MNEEWPYQTDKREKKEISMLGFGLIILGFFITLCVYFGFWLCG